MALDVAQNTYPRNILEPAIVTGSQFRLPVNLKASTTFYRGLAIAESIATPGTFAPYNSGGSDGEDSPTAICPINCSTDASGNITYGSAADPAGRTEKTIDAWFGGVFATADLVRASSTAINTTVVAKLGKLLRGTVTSGLLRLG